MPKITFIVDHTPKGQSPDIPTYKAGESYDLEASYAEKYIARGWAKPYEKPEKPRRERVSSPPALPAEPDVAVTTETNENEGTGSIF